MITLRTLENATAQEVFDQVATHLLTQKQKSVNGAQCAYLNNKGLKCAAGCLIAIDEYSLNLEGNSWKELFEKNEVPSIHVDLITDLQEIHDEYDPSEWKNALGLLATYMHLNTKVLDLPQETC